MARRGADRIGRTVEVVWFRRMILRIPLNRQCGINPLSRLGRTARPSEGIRGIRQGQTLDRVVRASCCESRSAGRVPRHTRPTLSWDLRRPVSRRRCPEPLFRNQALAIRTEDLWRGSRPRASRQAQEPNSASRMSCLRVTGCSFRSDRMPGAAAAQPSVGRVRGA
jgi:hypothetical protein